MGTLRRMIHKLSTARITRAAGCGKRDERRAVCDEHGSCDRAAPTAAGGVERSSTRAHPERTDDASKGSERRLRPRSTLSLTYWDRSVFTDALERVTNRSAVPLSRVIHNRPDRLAFSRRLDARPDRGRHAPDTNAGIRVESRPYSRAARVPRPVKRCPSGRSRRVFFG